MFFTLFVIGAVGFLTMALLSFGHFGGLRGGHHSIGIGGHGGHALPGAHAGHASPAHTGAHHPATHQGSHPTKGGHNDGLKFAWLIPTPIDIFSYCLGFGAAGMVLGHTLAGGLLVAAAVVIALAYNLLLIHPVMALALKFVSRESQGLEGTVGTEAEATGHFDADGRGIVRMTLDGQIVQLLATLEPTELAKGVTVCRGDKVFVLEIDATRNVCRVSRELAA